MKKNIFLSIMIIFLGCTSSRKEDVQQKFEPTFASLEKADPAPEWFMDAKFGIYFHWGVYSVPAFANEWYPRNMYRAGSDENIHHANVYGAPTEWPYHNFITGAPDKQGNFIQFAPKLKSEGGNFDPEEWAQLFADAGARFAGPVAEHHDGFSMWASKVNPWNAQDKGPKLDLVGVLTDAIRKKDMKVILSMHHAYNITGFYNYVSPSTDSTLQKLYGQLGKEANEALWLKKHKEIIDNYQPDIIWQDFNLHRISQPVLLEFLSYYYNQGLAKNKEVVATYKDGLNARCAVLDYERGGPTDITEKFWLTDDAISSSSWCYTEGIGYYSQKQVLHGFLDRVSKNGNLLLNISPKADGTIPQEQKDILLTMGAWLKKYGEAVYSTRAWEKYGEGPTRMGAAHGVFQEPAEGTSSDVRYTRSKDNTALYAILLGWDKGQSVVNLASLGSKRINIQNLKSVELLTDASKKQALTFEQDENGLAINLPDRTFEELAYVLKLGFDEKIPVLDKYAELTTAPHYYMIPGYQADSLAINSQLTLARRKNIDVLHWKLISENNGLYKIASRANNKQVLTLSGEVLTLSDDQSSDNQLWKIETTYRGLYKIRSKQAPDQELTLANGNLVGTKLEAQKPTANGSFLGWQLQEVCERMVQPFKSHRIPGTVEAEDFNTGCPADAYADRDEINRGGKYRPAEGVDIETCSVGGFNVGWIEQNEWLTYNVTVKKSGTYKVSFFVAVTNEHASLRLKVDDEDKTGSILLPDTGGNQAWASVEKVVTLDAGDHVLTLAFESFGFNIDKMKFEEVK